MGSAFGQVAYGPIDLTAPVADQVAQLDRRTRDTRDLANRLERDLRDLTDRTAGVEASLQEALQRESAQRRQDLRELAAGGLRRESLGLSLTALGTLVAAFKVTGPGAGRDAGPAPGRGLDSNRADRVVSRLAPGSLNPPAPCWR